MAPSRGIGLVTASASFKTPLSLSRYRAGLTLLRPSPALYQQHQRLQQPSSRRSIFTTTPPPTPTPPVTPPATGTTSTFTSLLDSGVDHVHTGLTFLHTTAGLPWYITLPLAAILVRTTIVLPLMLVGQRVRQQQVALTPQVQEARPELERKVLREHPEMGPKQATRMLSWELVKKRRQLEREKGVRTGLRWVPLAQLPVWLLVIDTVRRMAGQGGGLLSWISGRSEIVDGNTAVRAEKGVAGGSGAETETPTRSSGTQFDSFNSTSSMTNTYPSTDLLDPTTSTSTSTSTSTTTETLLPSTIDLSPLNNSLYTPTFSTGGTLWFPDLLQPDPLLLLPFTLSLLLYHGIRREEKLYDSLGLQRSRPSRILTNTLKVFSLAVGPLTLNIPAAVMLYWTTSAATGLVQKRVVDWAVPVDREAVARAVEKGRREREGKVQVQGPGQGQGQGKGEVKTPYRPKRSRRK